MADLGKRIHDLRKARGLTLEQVGQAVGVGRSTVRKWENGIIANMKRDKIKKLSECLGSSPAYIMGWTDDPNGRDSKEKPTPASEGEPHVNIVKIAGRDGSFVEKRLTDKQLQALKSFVDLLPDASDDL